MSGPELLTVAEMSEADRLAVEGGVPSLELMENAGRQVALAVMNLALKSNNVVVLCGPGNNGGDGYVAARLLKNEGWSVYVESYGDPAQLKDDALEMYRRWDGETRPLSAKIDAEIIVDALFGAGLSRPLAEDLKSVVKSFNASNALIIAVDVPSGLSGDLGRPFGDVAVRASATVTFFRKKPGHLLMPGRLYCGKTQVADIGIPDKVLFNIRPQSFESGPDFWGDAYPWPRPEGHKYLRGHVVVISGPASATGAARLAARGALRIGAGLVTLASPSDALAINAAHLTAIMLKPCDDAKALMRLLEDKRLNTVALGPGLGIGAATEELVAAALGSGAASVLDADALSSFAGKGEKLFAMLHDRVVMTPHEGEFKRLFPGLLERGHSRLEAASFAARAANCTLLLKGPDTVVASPDGRAAINSNAPAELATAGAGDVLAGFVAGLLAQSMAPFEAASAAAWLHGEAANLCGPGLIAEDLPEMLPKVLRDLKALTTVARAL
nr:MAG: NAD(P)H-hydrate dehydratase [Hyphomicrobiales bacterium]